MFLIFYLLSPVISQLCAQYSCKSSTVSFPPGQCISSSQQITQRISLSICTDQYHYYCPPDLSNTTCQLPPSTPSTNIASVGEPCTFDENCLDSICVQGICSGLPANSSCSEDTQCGVGLYCNNICLPQTLLNSPCHRDEMCANSLGCFENKCVNYFILQGFTELENCVNNENFLCATGACFESEGSFYCLPSIDTQTALKTPANNPLPADCSEDDDCLLVFDEGLNDTSRCSCGFNGFGSSFCGLFPGDQAFVNYTQFVNAWVNSENITKCHTARRTNLNCIKNYWNYPSFVSLAYFQAFAHKYPEVVYNDDCVKNIYQPYFWNLQQQYQQIQQNNPDVSHSVVLVFLSYFILAS